jgi:arylsulfatase A-like enzyme
MPPRPCSSSIRKPRTSRSSIPELSQPPSALRQRSQEDLDKYTIEPFDGYAPDLPAANAADGKEMLRNILGNVKKAAASVTNLDATVQKVLAKVRARGLSSSTLVVFTSCTGALWGRHGLWESPMRSDPPNMYDDAVATPMIWSWPGHIPAIAHRPELVSAYDFVPSICDCSASRSRSAICAAGAMCPWPR